MITFDLSLSVLSAQIAAARIELADAGISTEGMSDDEVKVAELAYKHLEGGFKELGEAAIAGLGIETSSNGDTSSEPTGVEGFKKTVSNLIKARAREAVDALAKSAIPSMLSRTIEVIKEDLLAKGEDINEHFALVRSKKIQRLQDTRTLVAHRLFTVESEAAFIPLKVLEVIRPVILSDEVQAIADRFSSDPFVPELLKEMRRRAATPVSVRAVLGQAGSTPKTPRSQ